MQSSRLGVEIGDATMTDILAAKEGDVMAVIHRWQPTYYTPCGLSVTGVTTNLGRELDDGVTCKNCARATTRVSVWREGTRALQEHIRSRKSRRIVTGRTAPSEGLRFPGEGYGS
jgi:hypothetical protein